MPARGARLAGSGSQPRSQIWTGIGGLFRRRSALSVDSTPLPVSSLLAAYVSSVPGDLFSDCREILRGRFRYDCLMTVSCDRIGATATFLRERVGVDRAHDGDRVFRRR